MTHLAQFAVRQALVGRAVEQPVRRKGENAASFRYASRKMRLVGHAREIIHRKGVGWGGVGWSGAG